MNTKINQLFGIISVVLGLLIIIFPLEGNYHTNVLGGFAILVFGIWLLIWGNVSYSYSPIKSIIYLILGVSGIVIGVGLFGYTGGLNFLISYWFYLAGFFLISLGIIIFVTGKNTLQTLNGILGILLGFTYVILASYAWDPFSLTAIIGIWMIITGLIEFY